MQPGFRQDIQGLRALAVLLVVLDHSRVGPFRGGFVGVDVFFVISGYLITGLLVTEAEGTGHVSLLGFYARRARRILPAATLVIVATVAGSIIVLSAVEANDVIKDALWATFFLANIKFARDGTNYFHADATTSPLQHYWSLAVEEQFYVVWPLCVLLICLVARWLAHRSSGRRSTGANVRRVATYALLAIVGVSFAWSIIDGHRNSVGGYFSPFTRAWELGVGALAVCLSTWLVKLPAAVQALLGWAGLGAVLVSSLVYTGNTLFPGYAAALPVLGAAALLLGGLRPAGWGPQRLLELPPVRTIGDWSYSIYLWHWPILILIGAKWHRPHGWSGLAVIALVIGLSALTFRFVEDPVRRARLFRRRRLRAVLLYPAVVLLTLPLLAAANAMVKDEVNHGGPPITTSSFGQPSGSPAPTFSPDPVVALVQASIQAARNGVAIPAGLKPPLLQLDQDIPDLGKCQYFAINTDRPLCPRGDTSGTKKLILIGDSHARQWVPAIDPLSKQYGYESYYLIREGCPSSEVTPWMVHGGPSVNCANFQEWAREQVQTMHPDVVVLGSNANSRGFTAADGSHVSDLATMARMYQEGMEQEIDDLAPYTKRIVIIGDPPAVTKHPGRCLSERGATLKSCLSPEDQNSLTFINALRMAAAAKGVQFVETASWFCDDGICPSVVGQYIAHRDRTHISQSYAGYLTDELEGQLRLDDPSQAPTEASAASPSTSPSPSDGAS